MAGSLSPSVLVTNSVRPPLNPDHMDDVPSSPRGARLAALMVMAETVVVQTDGEKGNRDWKGRCEVVESIALLVQSFVLSRESSVRIAFLHPPVQRDLVVTTKSLRQYSGWLKKNAELTI